VRVAERLADLPGLNIAGLLTTPEGEEGPLAFFRTRLDRLLAIPLEEGEGVLIAAVPGADKGMDALALRSHFERQRRPVEVRTCSRRLLELLLAQWRTARVRAGTGSLDRTRLEADWEKVLADAIRANASDIHIERSYETCQVKFRVNGLLQPYADWPADYADALAQMLYTVAADADGKDTTYDPKAPQDGRIGQTVTVTGERHEVSIRFASMPVRGGNDVTLRILPEGRGGPKASLIPLETLGYADSQIELIKRMVAQPVGAVIMAGITGSGKSTTLKSLLMWLDRLHRTESKLRSIEDPPEYTIPGVRQSPVVRSQQREGEGSPFAVMIRAAMRGDPDIIMIGEVRDPDTVELLVGATLSGHKVLCTVHASSANAVPARLFTINAHSPVNVREVIAAGDFLAGAIYQRLLPVLCPHCSRRVERWDEIQDHENQAPGLRDRLRAKANLDTDHIRVRGPGCDRCRSGIASRTICAETVLPDFEMLRLYGAGNDHEALRHWRALYRPAGPHEPYQALGGFALDHGLYKMRQGLLDPTDVELSLGLMDHFDGLPTAAQAGGNA
jgi:general secretion pathway protein E